MNKEKLKEAAAAYIEEANVSRKNFELSDLEDAVCVGAEWLEAQPLEERVTPGEIRRISGEALASQWFDPEELLPVKERDVLIFYRSRYKGKLIENFTVDSRSDWYDPFEKKDWEIIAWMYVPQLPKNLSY